MQSRPHFQHFRLTNWEAGRTGGHVEWFPDLRHQFNQPMLTPCAVTKAIDAWPCELWQGCDGEGFCRRSWDACHFGLSTLRSSIVDLAYEL